MTKAKVEDVQYGTVEMEVSRSVRIERRQSGRKRKG